MTVTSSHAAPVVFNDMPARITDADGNTLFGDKCRITCVPILEGQPGEDGEPGGLYVYAASPGGQVKTVFALDPYLKYEHDGTHYIFTSAVDGAEYHVYRGNGCGCGDPARRMTLPSLRYLNQPDPTSVQH